MQLVFSEFFEYLAQNGPENPCRESKQAHHGPHMGSEAEQEALEKIEGGLAVDIFLKIEDYHGQRVAQLRSTILPTSPPVVRQSKVKGRSLIHFSLSPDPAAVTLDDALDDGQADAGAFVFFPRVQALEGAEEVAEIALIKPNPIVLDVVNIFFARGAPTHLDDCGLPGFGEFDGVGQ